MASYSGSVFSKLSLLFLRSSISLRAAAIAVLLTGMVVNVRPAQAAPA
jgi:hypothetical protein